MYSTSLSYKLKSLPSENDHRILQFFFKAWVDDVCKNEVGYTQISNDSIQVDFEHPEDAVALKLKGIPCEFQNYLEIVN